MENRLAIFGEHGKPHVHILGGGNPALDEGNPQRSHYTALANIHLAATLHATLPAELRMTALGTRKRGEHQKVGSVARHPYHQALRCRWRGGVRVRRCDGTRQQPSGQGSGDWRSHTPMENFVFLAMRWEQAKHRRYRACEATLTLLLDVSGERKQMFSCQRSRSVLDQSKQ